jgi:hypothetical protein
LFLIIKVAVAQINRRGPCHKFNSKTPLKTLFLMETDGARFNTDDGEQCRGISSMRPLRKLLRNVTSILALVLSVSTTAVLITIVFTTTYLTTSGLYSSTQRAVYVTLTTVLATLIAAFVASQLQHLLLQRIDRQLASVSNTEEGIKLKALDAQWQAVLNVAGVRDTLHNIPIKITFLVVGLITAAIVAGFTPSTTIRVFPYNPVIPLGPNTHCVYSIYNLTYPEDYSWNLGNGSSLFIQANMGWCPTREAVTLSGGINIVNPDDYAYADTGVAVHSSAIGTPISVYSSEKIDDPELNILLELHGSSVVGTTQCVPVMEQNPISCRKGGFVSVDLASSSISVSDDNISCSYTEQHLLNPATYPTSMIMKMCPHGEVGQGTIVLGAVGRNSLSLAGAIGDFSFFNSGNTDSSYVVTCQVDTRHVYGYRKVILELQATNVSESSYSRALVGYDACTPKVWTIGTDLIATSAAANWQLLVQNNALDGWFDTINQLTSGSGPLRSPPWAFNNSENALEDILGLTAALVGSRINSSAIILDGTTSILATRIGSGNVFALVFAIPPMGAALILLYLLITGPQTDPGSFKSSRLGDLIQLGKAANPATRAN